MKKVGNYNITDEILNQMKNFINKASKNNTERGFKICENIQSKQLSVGSKCIGDSCSLDLGKSKCKKGSKKIGSFHTHPDSDTSDLSMEDMLVFYGDKEKISCVGTSNDIKCYIPSNKNCTEDTTHKLIMKQHKRYRKIEQPLMDKYDLDYGNPDDYEKIDSVLESDTNIKLDNIKKLDEQIKYQNKCYKEVEI